MDNKTYELISESFYNTYYSMGTVLAEALGLISEKRAVHKVGEVKRTQPRGMTQKGEYQVPGSRGKPGTGEGGRPQTTVNPRTGETSEVPGAHSTGGQERGVKKGEKAAARAKKDKAEADANNAAYRSGSRMK
jgi:hypothetical protein